MKKYLCLFVSIMTICNTSCNKEETEKTASCNSEHVEKETTNNDEYVEIANRIINKIALLKNKYPHLLDINPTARMEESKNELWISFRYVHGMKWIPNPQYQPGKKSSRRIRTFLENDGIELILYFFKGDWQGQLAVFPKYIGEMKIVVLMNGGNDKIAADINSIINTEKLSFEKPNKEIQN